HEGKNSSPNLTDLQSLGIRIQGESPLSTEHILDRLLLSMIAEAIRCYDEDVAGSKSQDALGQIDLASVMGFGFPPFRGGVMYFAKNQGIKNVLNKLETLKSKGERFILKENKDILSL